MNLFQLILQDVRVSNLPIIFWFGLLVLFGLIYFFFEAKNKFLKTVIFLFSIVIVACNTVFFILPAIS